MDGVTGTDQNQIEVKMETKNEVVDDECKTNRVKSEVPYRIRPAIRSGQLKNPRQKPTFLYPVKVTRRPTTVLPMQPSIRRIQRKPAEETQVRDASTSSTESPPPIKVDVKKALEDIDREYEKEFGPVSRPDWLAGSPKLRRAIVRMFPRNMHPSPEELQATAEEYQGKYYVCFQNYQRLRIHHKIECEPNDNCERIKKYFESSASKKTNSRLTSDARALLEKEMYKYFEKSLKLSIGQMHVIADKTGLLPSVIQPHCYSMRRRFVSLAAKSDQELERNKIGLQEEFDANPFPNPTRYRDIATQFEIEYEEVLGFFNAQRIEYMKEHGPYPDVKQDIDEMTSDALWEVARKGRHLGYERRLRLSLTLSISYTTVAFWLDNYVSQLRWGTDLDSSESEDSD